MSLLPDPFLSQINPVHASPSHLLKTGINIVLPSTLSVPQVFPLRHQPAWSLNSVMPNSSVKDRACLHSFYSGLFLMMFMKIKVVDVMRHLIIYAMTLQLYQSLFTSSFITCGQAGRIDHHCMHSLCEQRIYALYMTWGL